MIREDRHEVANHILWAMMLVGDAKDPNYNGCLTHELLLDFASSELQCAERILDRAVN